MARRFDTFDNWDNLTMWGKLYVIGVILAQMLVAFLVGFAVGNMMVALGLLSPAFLFISGFVSTLVVLLAESYFDDLVMLYGTKQEFRLSMQN